MAAIENQSVAERLVQLEQENAALLARNAELLANSEREKEESERKNAAMKAAIEELKKKLGNESDQSENFGSSSSSKDGSDSFPKDGTNSSVPPPSGSGALQRVLLLRARENST